jgi:hypothetical protein
VKTGLCDRVVEHRAWVCDRRCNILIRVANYM